MKRRGLRLRLPVEAVLHVGDDYELDVVGARAAGLSAVHLDRHGRGPSDERVRIASLTQLLDAAHITRMRPERTSSQD